MGRHCAKPTAFLHKIKSVVAVFKKIPNCWDNWQLSNLITREILEITNTVLYKLCIYYVEGVVLSTLQAWSHGLIYLFFFLPIWSGMALLLIRPY